MNWLKLHHGTPSDPKWAVIAKRSGIPRHAVVAVWCAMLDHASQNTPRGSLARLDTEMIAVSLDLETEQVDAIVTAMRERGIVADETVTNWTKRQTGTSTERVRRFRERSSDECNAPETQNETTSALRNGDETIEKRRTEEKRTEEIALGGAAPSDAAKPEQPIEIVGRLAAEQPGPTDPGPIPDFLDRKKTKRRTSLVAEFLITPGDKRHAYARGQGMTDDEIAIECEKFENHHRAKGSVMADWDAAWRTWCCNRHNFRPSPPRAMRG